ncbi:hypothetical protein [Mycoplasmopsis agassizii]|uniref:Lipoprotein n=1 Tax=Mycoplasmopsis agassizii TaxID=33922 RepID=A0ABX4H524_9BACT|nr:hypothetical protein [Mycoplasmopsis agassizii]PAF54990.1 hypothetical protein CJF60_04635 [Mycoplasmopsis agassizii]SMC17632.1 hypothetical protein SAMN02745179_00512 [Mycoplasmopsis agassizii]
MLISSKSKYKKRKAFLILLASSSFLAITATLVACTSKVNIDTPPDNKGIYKEPEPLENKNVSNDPASLDDKGYAEEPISPFSKKGTSNDPATFYNKDINNGVVSYVKSVIFGDKRILKGSGLFDKKNNDRK